MTACGFCAKTAGAFVHIHDGYHIERSAVRSPQSAVRSPQCKVPRWEPGADYSSPHLKRTQGVHVNPNSKQRDPEKRIFVESSAAFLGTSLLLGCVGPSSCGKTYSALALARGIQRVSGGHITVIDTEAGRANLYAPRFQFKLPDGSLGLRHIPFSPPFSPLDYLAVIEGAVARGAKVIVVDSMSHEHEGEGGVLEMHEEDMGGDDRKNFTAWARPKAQRRQLIGRILQMKGVHFIFCFRAKEKLRYVGGKPEIRGLMPQAGEEFIYEQTMNFLLPLGANGVPVLDSSYEDEKIMIKIPEQFRPLFAEPRQLSADLGQHLAMWAAGSSLPAGMVAPKLVAAPGKPGTVPTPIATVAPTQTTAPTSSAPATPTVTTTTSAPPAAVQAAPLTAVVASVRPATSADEVIALYVGAKTRDEMKALRPQYDAVFATASETDRVRMKAAGNAAAERTSAAGAWGLTGPQQTPAATPTMTPVDAIISLYDRAPTRAVVRELRPQFDAVYDKASEVDRARMNAAGKSAVDRLVAAELAQPQTSQVPAAPMQTTTTAPVSMDPTLEAQAKLHAEGMAAFRSSLDSLGPEITQEQAAQLVIDHMAARAKEPKVSTEDGVTAQAEIMAHVVPKFASKASLGVMVRHMTYCAGYRVYKTYCDDLMLCTTAQNVYECWKTNGALVDSLPDEVKKEARLRTGKRIEAVDEKIPAGGVWLTKRIKEAREAASGPAAGGGSTTASSTAAVAAAAVPPVAPTLPTNGTPAATNGNGSADVHQHAPIESDLGQRIALLIDGATLQTILDLKSKIERNLFQTKLTRKDAETLLSLYGDKLAALASA